MIRRLSQASWIWCALALALSCLLAPAPARADGVEIIHAHLEPGDEGVRLAAAFSLELNRGLEEALLRGIPMYFTTEVEIARPRWYWFDETTLRAAQTVRLSYNVLTRQYRTSSGGLQQSYTSLDDALSIIRRPPRWLVAPRGTLKYGETYQVSIRMGLDVGQLPKPFQVNAMNNSDWRLSSDWKSFGFRMDGR
ncbi:MAG: hypothetical protein JWP36_1424 [Paucimonas sp.]|nr:hypothetical protein [Paucimonas sp.]